MCYDIYDITHQIIIIFWCNIPFIKEDIQMGLFSSFKKKEIQYNDTDIIALANADIIPTEEINDPVFSKELLGQTIAFNLQDETIVAPCNGVLEVMYPTGHAFGIRRPDGLGVLVHVGINTVNLNGKGFKLYAKQGETVKAGQKLIKVSAEWIRDEGYDLSTMLIITESLNKDERIQFIDKKHVTRGEIINK